MKLREPNAIARAPRNLKFTVGSCTVDEPLHSLLRALRSLIHWLSNKRRLRPHDGRRGAHVHPVFAVRGGRANGLRSRWQIWRPFAARRALLSRFSPLFFLLLYRIHAQSLFVFKEWDLDDNVDSSARTILSRNSKPGETKFSVYRTVLKSPTFHQQVWEKVASSAPNVVIVEPLVLSLLAKIYLSANPQANCSLS